MIAATEHLSSASNQRIEVIALAVIVCLAIFELLRRKRLLERYAIVWFVAGVSVLVLALWRGLLTTLSHAVGIYYPPSALFAVTFLFVLVMLVNFSTTVSRLSDQNNVLAQRLALLQRRLEEQEADVSRDEPLSGRPSPPDGRKPADVHPGSSNSREGTTPIRRAR